MNGLRQRRWLFALLALLLVFAGCKGESPTAPAPGTGGGSSGGGTPPPVGANVTLTVSNATPLAGSTTTITATVSVDGNPAPNGTAVEFSSTPIGVFSDSGTNTTIRTTTNGVATATLTAATAGTATVTAVVNNVSRTTTITFTARPTTPIPPDTAPAITAVNPGQGSPNGGEVVTITGRNFTAPVRVVFDFGNGVTRDATVVSATSTQIQVLTPRTDLGTGQTQSATIIVFTSAGTAAENRATAAFTYRRNVLTPTIVTVSPDSGPINGGTRITIFGDGFEAPVQVAFRPAGATAWSMMEVVNITFNQIIAVTPTARDVNPDGSGALTGPVDLRVLNINSNTNAILAAAFRYTAKMQITSISPAQGTALGGTRVQIDGIGFEPPVNVNIGGVQALVSSVSGTRIIAITPALLSPCSGSAGPVAVTNINNGDFDTFGDGVNENSFQFIPVNPFITNIAASAGGAITPGSVVNITVQDPGTGIVRFQIGGNTVLSSPPVSTNGLGAQVFAITLPTTGFTFPTAACTTVAGTPGQQFASLSQNIAFNNLTTGCSNTLTNGITINPPAPNTCTAPPPQATIAPASPTCVTAPNVAAAGTTTTSGTVTITNAANVSPLVISAATATPTTNATTVTVTPPSAFPVTIPAGGSAIFTLTIDPAAAGASSGSVSFTTNDPTKPTVTGCVSTTGT